MSYEFVVEVDHVIKEYKSEFIAVRALDDLCLKVRKGEFLSVMGPSGSGKTTLFNAIGALDKPTKGKIFIDGVDITELDAFELAWLRCRKIGYVFQTFNLLPVLTALENVALPTVFAGLTIDEGRKKAHSALEMVGLGGRENHKPAQLSAGQQQRVAIARAIVNDPSLVLADELTGNLDLRTGLAIIGLLREMNRSKEVTIVAATHDLKMIGVSDRIVYLRDGRFHREETREEIAL